MIGGASSRLSFATATNEAFRVSVVWTQSDGVTPVDLTGYSFRMQARTKPKSDDVVFEASTANGMISTVDPDGRIDISIPLNVMSAVAPGVYHADLVATDPGGVPTRLFPAVVRVDEGVTR